MTGLSNGTFRMAYTAKCRQLPLQDIQVFMDTPISSPSTSKASSSDWLCSFLSLFCALRVLDVCSPGVWAAGSKAQWCWVQEAEAGYHLYEVGAQLWVAGCLARVWAQCSQTSGSRDLKVSRMITGLQCMLLGIWVQVLYRDWVTIAIQEHVLHSFRQTVPADLQPY